MNNNFKNIESTSIQDEDRRTDESREVKTILLFSEVASNRRSHDETHTGGGIETSYDKEALPLRHQIRNENFWNRVRVFENSYA